jgi:ATP-dependent RNA helicase DeaD
MSLSLSDQNTESTFDHLNLSGPLLQAIESAGYLAATPIQARAIPLLLAGRDVLGQAQTGTGKTAAFAVPMLQGIDLEKRVPQVLVLTPTRELAIQVAEAFKRYAVGLKGLRAVAIYGGQDYHTQFRQLDRGVHVVVGTPGRVMDHMRRGSLKLDGLRGLVLDEADEMLRMGFAEDVDWILTQAPAQRQIALFSATMPESIRRIAQRHLRNPAEITIKQKAATADTVRQRFVVVGPQQKEEALARILEAESIEAVLVFVNTKNTTEPLAEYLSRRGHRTAALSSDVSQNQRERIVERLRAGKLDVIVATDVAARGLDVQRISHVINYDFPMDSENYVHRIGRTGRAGRSGQAILFLHPRGRHLLRRIEQATRQTIELMDVPTNQDINQRRVERFHERITASIAHPDLAAFTSLVEQYRANNDVPLDRVAAALAVIAAGDKPLFLTDLPDEVTFTDTREGRDGSRRESMRRTLEAGGRVGPDSRGQRGRGDGRPPERMETYRIAVGRVHQVKPANIVGAIANETGLESRFIGRIEIFDEHSTVDLLEGMPHKIFHTLKKVKIAGRALDISRADEAAAPEDWPIDDPGNAPAGAVRAAAGVSEAPDPQEPAGAPESKSPAPKDRPLGKKIKAKSKAKRIITKSKGGRSAGKRLLSTR